MAKDPHAPRPLAQPTVIDPERAGGTGADAPKRITSYPMMTYAEAQEIYGGMEWRTLRTRTHRVMDAMVQEIERLRASVTQLEAECEETSGEWLQALDIIGKLQLALARVRAAIPVIIGCIDDNAAACRERPSAFKCCELRHLFTQHGLLTPASEAPKEDAPDGA